MVKHHPSRCWPSVVLLLAVAGLCGAMAPRPTPPPVPMTFVRAETDPETGAIAIEWIVPNATAVGPLDRLELLILDSQAEALFGAMQVLGNQCDPVPPGAFGVVLDPTSDDRSIKNVASAGQNGQWDQEAPNGTLLKQSVSGITGGNLGIAFWIEPKEWSPGRHLILARAVRKKGRPEPWRNLATLDIADDGRTVISEWGAVQPVFQLAGQDEPVSLDHIGSVTLIRYEEKPQLEGVEIRRWEGDTSGQVRYEEIDRRELSSADLPDGLLSLQPGFYQFKHQSVSGTPPTGYYGESPIFEVTPENIPVEIQVQLFPAI
jgi:hypothetical protein